MQDLRQRSVTVWLFPLLALLLGALNFWQNQSAGYLWIDLAVNLLFLGVLLGGITLYFSVKYRTWINITRGLLGWGDILLLISIACYCSVTCYVLFNVFSLLLITIGWSIRQIITREKDQSVPLAGLQALLFAGVLLAGSVLPVIDLTRNKTLLNFWPW